MRKDPEHHWREKISSRLEFWGGFFSVRRTITPISPRWNEGFQQKMMQFHSRAQLDHRVSEKKELERIPHSGGLIG